MTRTQPPLQTVLGPALKAQLESQGVPQRGTLKRLQDSHHDGPWRRLADTLVKSYFPLGFPIQKVR